VRRTLRPCSGLVGLGRYSLSDADTEGKPPIPVVSNSIGNNRSECEHAPSRRSHWFSDAIASACAASVDLGLWNWFAACAWHLWRILGIAQSTVKLYNPSASAGSYVYNWSSHQSCIIKYCPP